MNHRTIAMLLSALLATTGSVSACAQVIEHVDVYKVAGRFGGWPANHGIWSWGDEILVGLQSGYFKASRRGHAIDSDQPRENLLARSTDGGRTWKIETPAALEPPHRGGKSFVKLTEPIDFSPPDLILKFGRSGLHKGAESWFWSSPDRGRSWSGPFRLPMFDLPGIAARTDYLVDGKHALTAMLTGAKSNGREGRPFCARTTDGGRQWEFVSWIGPEPDCPDTMRSCYSIMPATVRLSASRLVTTIRRKEGRAAWIEAFGSDDNGVTWTFMNRPAPDTGGGNPSSLIRLADGRLCVCYGYRASPFGMRAKLSADDGVTWGKEITLRDDGGCWDLGYPRSVQRTDGKVVTIYYFNEHTDGDRYIAATIWDPGRSGKSST